MAFAVGQAIFGERDRGHALLEASPKAAKAALIAGRMDIQGTVPPGTVWQPYFSGFAHEQHYILARTSADLNARRAGMVFSRALFIPIEELANLEDLDGLMSLLESLSDSRGSVEDIEWSGGPSETEADIGLANALVIEGLDPVIWPGEAAFGPAVAGIWRNLWPAARCAFSFRLAFTPQDISSNPPTVVSTPTTLVSRWSGYRIAKPAQYPVDDAAELLVGNEQSILLRKLMVALDAAVPNISDLSQLVEVRRALDGGATLDDMLGALRSVSYLSPSPTQGREVKGDIIRLTADATKLATTAEIRMARNLDLTAFPESSAFWLAIKEWTAHALWNEKDASGLTRLISDGFQSDGPIESWKNAVRSGVGQALNLGTDATIDGVWRVIEAIPALPATLMGTAKSADALEARLVERTPRQLAQPVAKQLMAASAAINRRSLHAACAASAYPLAEAVRLHLDLQDHDIASLEIALRHGSGKERVAVALQSSDEALVVIAARAVVGQPKLLSPIDVNNPRWREIWLQSMLLDIDTWEAPKAPRACADRLYSRLADGDLAVVPLLKALAVTPLGEIANHPQRAALWDIIPSDILRDILRRTADTYIASCITNACEEEVEPKLAEELVRPERREEIFQQLLLVPSQCTAVFRLLPKLDENDFVDWLSLMITEFKVIDTPTAESLGRLILGRNWQRAARALAKFAIDYQRSDLRPALQICVDLIGYFNQWDLNLWSQPPATVKWRILEEVVIELYPNGPDQDGLWSRAGGKKGSLLRHATGRQAWRHVIQEAENGKRDISIDELLKRMWSDYPSNAILAKLRWDPLFRGGGW